MVIAEPTRLRLAKHPVIAPRVIYTSGIATPEILAAYFEVDRVIIADQQENIANEGQVVSPADIWGDDVILAHVNPEEDLTIPTFGRTLFWADFGDVEDNMPIQLDMFVSNDTASEVYRARHFTDEKLIFAAAGYRLENVLAPLS